MTEEYILAVTPPDKFIAAHVSCIDSVTKAFDGSAQSDLVTAFINTYKIHVELTDAIVELMKKSHINHFTTGIILRSVYENLAMFKHLTTSDTKTLSKYKKKIEVFKNLDPNKVMKMLVKGEFSNLARFDQTNTSERMEKLSSHARMTYDMLSGYAHISPYVTVQMMAGVEKIKAAKRLHLQAMYLSYMLILHYAKTSGIQFEEQDRLLLEFNQLLEEGENQGVYG